MYNVVEVLDALLPPFSIVTSTKENCYHFGLYNGLVASYIGKKFYQVHFMFDTNLKERKYDF